MAQKQSLLGRIAQLAAADPTTFVPQSDDPLAMRDQLAQHFDDSIGEAERAITQTIGNLRLGEADHAEDVAAAKEWGAQAATVSQQADELRRDGHADMADRMDGLAKTAISKQLRFESIARHSAPLIASQAQVVETLKAGLLRMKAHRSNLQSMQIATTADVPPMQRPAIGGLTIDVLDPTNEVTRFEELVRRLSAPDRRQAPDVETAAPSEERHPVSEENEENN